MFEEGYAPGLKSIRRGARMPAYEDVSHTELPKTPDSQGGAMDKWRAPLGEAYRWFKS
jgi:hypothetical protein